MLEILIVLSILGVLLGVGASSIRPPSASAFANDVRALIQQARFESIKRNVPVSVVWDQETTSFVVGIGPSGDLCAIADVIARATALDYPRLVVDPGFPEDGGLVWIPSGQARACNLGTFSEAIATLDDGRVQRRLTTTLTGRVIIE